MLWDAKELDRDPSVVRARALRTLAAPRRNEHEHTHHEKAVGKGEEPVQTLSGLLPVGNEAGGCMRADALYN